MANNSRMVKFKSKRTPFQNAMAAMFLAILTIFLLSAIPTQWFASTMKYDRGLGEPFFAGADFSIYFPLAWVEWGWRLADYEPLKQYVKTMLFMGIGSSAAGMFSGLFYVFVLVKRKAGMDELHGSAHWADTDEVDSTGFFPTPGRPVSGAMVGSVMLDSKNRVIHPMHPKFDMRYVPEMVKKGKFSLRKEQARNKDGVPVVKLSSLVKRVELLRDDNPAHILAFAPTRSGKGVGLVLPTLLTWRHSVLVNDIKGENWALTAGFRRAAGQHVVKFEPACLDGSGACWNPIDEIRLFTDMDVQDAQTIMNMVCDPKGEGLEDHWAKTSWEFLTGLALHLAYEGKLATMAGMAGFLGDPRWEDEKQMYTTMMQFEHDPGCKANWRDTENLPTRTHPAVANAAKTMLNKEDKERTSVLSTAKSFLSLYLDPVVARNTSRSDFSVRDLMNADKPVSCYYVVQPADLERMVSLSRLFYAMVIRRNAADMQFAGGTSVQGYKHRLLLLIDELPSLRKLTVLQEGLGYIAGYGMKCYLICQDLIQLEEAYGDKQTIVAGCHVRIAYAPNTQETADKLAAMTGKTTIIEESHSTSYKQWGIDAGNVSVSTNKNERELMTAAEFLALSPEDMVLFVAGRAPIYGRKIKYYEDEVMLKRAEKTAPEKSDVVRVAKVVEAVVVKNSVSGEGGGGEGVVGGGGGNVSESVMAALEADKAKRIAWQKKMAAAAGAVDDLIGGSAGGSGAGEEGGEGRNGTVVGMRRHEDAPVVQRAVKKSFYDGRKVEMTAEEKEKIMEIARVSGVVERVAALNVF